MRHKVLIAYEIDMSPDDRLNVKLERLGDGWKIIDAKTVTETFETGTPPSRHFFITVTVVVEKILSTSK